MKLELGISLGPDAVTSLPAHPYAFLEANVQGQLVPESDDGAFQKQLAAMRAAPRPVVALNCYLPGGLKCVGPQVDEARLERYAHSACARAQQAGIDTIVFGSGGARSIPKGWAWEKAMEQFADYLRVLGPIAARHNVTVVIEPLNRAECNFINSLEEGAEAVNRARHASVRLLADFFHMLRDGEPPAAIRPVAPLLRHVHLAEREERTAPGVHGDDFRPYLAALREAGYSGRLTIEAVWKQQPPEVVPAVAALERQVEDAGYTVMRPA